MKHPPNFLLILLPLILAAVFLTGCSGSEGQQTNEDPAPAMANPASVYCQGLGFVEETRENDLGQFGVCLFPDGTECDTWDFLAGRCGMEYSYCQQQGHTLETKEDENIATCRFEDGTSCSELLYFQGECGPAE